MNFTRQFFFFLLGGGDLILVDREFWSTLLGFWMSIFLISFCCQKEERNCFWMEWLVGRNNLGRKKCVSTSVDGSKL